MPESDTEIPHFAFTHHRIGLHDTDEAQRLQSELPQQLVPLADVSHLSQLDQDRCLGLAYVQVSDLPEHQMNGEHYRRQAREILADVRRRGLRDPAVDAALARLYWGLNASHTITLSQAVLATNDATPDDRSTALFTLATTYFQQQQFGLARPLLEELVQVRRYADAWNALSVCYESEGDIAGAIDAMLRAVEISPFRSDFRARLASLYGQDNQFTAAEKHRHLSNRLQQIHKSH